MPNWSSPQSGWTRSSGLRFSPGHALNPENLRIVLVDTRNPLNIGAAARAISNFGFRHLRLVTPYDVAYQEARSAVNAAEILKNAQDYRTLAEAIADCTVVVGTTSLAHRECSIPCAGWNTPAAFSEAPRLRTSRLAVRLGEIRPVERRSRLLSLAAAHRHPREHASMNLGQAVAVCLYELSRKAAVAKIERRRRAASEDLERMTSLLVEVLQESGYVHSASVEAKTRRLVRRLDLPAHDVEVWLGMLRQIR